MTALDVLLPTPRMLEIETIDLFAPPAEVWRQLKSGDLVDSPLIRALFLVRTLPSRLGDRPPQRATLLCLDDLRSSPEKPGFQVLAEVACQSITVGAIGKVWQLDIPFLHVESIEAYAVFSDAGWIKVAWEIRLEPLGIAASRLALEVRVDATDDASWKLFERYWKLIGPGSHFVRRSLLSSLLARFGDPDAREEEQALPGDDLLTDAAAQVTRGITIRATPEAIWPWLVQMGCGRAGFYSIDALDNGGVPSAQEVISELQQLAVGQVIPAAPGSAEGFEVLAIEPQTTLVLGGLFDSEAARQLPFSGRRPAHYWHVTWVFFLEPRSSTTTRLHVRARAAFSPSERLHLAWIRPVHSLMQTSQLRHLRERAEGRLRRDSLGDVGEGLKGAGIIALSFLTPFLRSARNHWGLSAEEAGRPRAGDELVSEPLWSWTHAIEVPAPPDRIWPWLAQVGADRAGFYSYQWLENLAGTNLRNAERVHREWAHQLGDDLVLHPQIPPFTVVSLEPGRSLVAFAAPDEVARREGRPWAAASWALLVEPLESGRCRVVSRFRSSCSSDVATRLAQGPLLLEPVGFAMDRRMLLGLRERVL